MLNIRTRGAEEVEQWRVSRDYLTFGAADFSQFSAIVDSIFSSTFRDSQRKQSKQSELALSLLCEIVDEATKNLSEIFLPLSSGLDSRLLLAVLHRLGHRDKVFSFTIGHEGAKDFDFIGSYPSKLVPNHSMVNILDAANVWETRKEVENLRRVGFARVPLSPFGLGSSPLGHSGIVKNAVTGFLGDPISGSRMIPSFATGMKRRTFQRVLVRSDNFRDAGYGPSYEGKSVDYIKTFSRARGASSEMVDFAIRQIPYISRYHLVDQIAPFADKRWTDFCLSLNRHERLNRRFIFAFAEKRFPDFFGELAGTSVSRSVAEGGARPTKFSTALLWARHAGFRSFVRENVSDYLSRDLYSGSWKAEDISILGNNELGAREARQLFMIASFEIAIKAGVPLGVEQGLIDEISNRIPARGDLA